jgi:hypothetical protein
MAHGAAAQRGRQATVCEGMYAADEIVRGNESASLLRHLM